MEARRILEAVEPVLRGLREEVLAVWRGPVTEVERKPDGTYVTPLDRSIESTLVDLLLGMDGSWGVTGEEGGVYREGSPRWVIDPLDGTLNFLRRLPLFATQLALVDGARPLFGVIYDPLSDDLAWVAAGEGAWREGERMRVSERSAREMVLLADISKGGLFAERPEVLMGLRRKVLRLRSLGSVAVHFREIASGRAEAYVAAGSHPSHLHDFAPGALMVREAGGLVTTFDGTDPFEDARTILSAPPALHAHLRPLLAGA